jgi:transcriptional regulator with XRE-family HTH domain
MKKRLLHSSNRGRRANIPWDVSITELAARLGYHASHVGRVLKGQASPGLGMAKALAKELGISVDKMLRIIQRGKEKRNESSRG